MDKQVTIVEVDKIQYNDPDTGYTDISGTLYVHKGKTVTFKAIPDPSTASWPSDKPVWGGSSGASGTGETTDVIFNTLSSTLSDYKTVTATCGNTVTANIVVFDFEGVFTPDDDFEDRSISDYGLEETVALTFTTDPTGVTAAQAGGLEWTLDGVGELTNAGNDGTANYDAKETEGNPWFTLAIKSGPSKYDFKSYNKGVIPPSVGYFYSAYTPPHIWHKQGYASVGFEGIIYIGPKHVSFSNIWFKEGEDDADLVGFYEEKYPNGKTHPADTIGKDVGGGNIDYGCLVAGLDKVSTGPFDGVDPEFSSGSLTWLIPWMYSITMTGDGIEFGDSATHIATINGTGRTTIEKKDVGPYAKNLMAPDSPY